MYTELDEIAENIFNALSESTIEHLRFSRPRIRALGIRALVAGQLYDETQATIDGVAEALTALIRQA